MQRKTGIWEGSIWEYSQPPILYSWYSCWYCIFFLDKGFLGITKAITILSSQKILRGTLPSWKKSRGEINIFSVPIQRSLIFTPLYNFFIKKYRTGLSDVWWVCSKTFYFEIFSAPTADTLFLLVLSILTLESVHSIRFLYQHFLSGITTKSLNTFYHACSYAKVDYSHFMNITAKVALRMILDS